MVDAHNDAPNELPDAGAPVDDARPAPREEVRLVPVRRAPNIVAFVLTGAVLGFILGAIVNQFGPFGGADFPFQLNYSSTTSLFYLGTVAALLGAGIGAFVAVLFERRR